MPICTVAAVAVEKTLPRFDRLFEYAVPAQLTLSPGCRCTVPFGAGNEARAGVVLSVREGDADGLKEVLSVQDAEPLLDRRALLAAAWLHDTTLCLWYDAVRQFLPPGLSATGPYQGRDGQQWIRLAAQYDPNAPLTEKQRRVTTFLEESGACSVKEAEYYVGCTKSVLDTLCRKQMIVYFEKPYEEPESTAEPLSIDHLILTPAQQAVADGLLDMLREGKGETALLYGVTGAGKTSVFLRLIASLPEDGGAIVLVPEISLTPQTTEVFRRYFGEDVVVLHSGLTLSARREAYRKLAEGRARICVGTRSAVFAPVQNLRLILLDEEQDSSYKSDRAPLYHARAVAQYRAAQSGALTLLASATPSLESYAAAKEGRYRLFTLTERYGNAVLPPVWLLDMREQARDGNTTAFHPILLDALEQNRKNGEQSILLLNRRGYHTTLTCTDCGAVVTCPNCSIAMTFHAANGRLMCHYCGHSQPLTGACPSCHGDHLRPAGLGTQRVEEQLAALLPDARILRMDADIILSRSTYAEQFGAFAAGEYDILLGTQMVAKGLNFPNATLVGVLNADNALYAQDFRSYEKAFALFTQVVGRCGRGEKPGRAYIQTMTPDNPVFGFAAAQDYPGFFAEEMQNRRLMLYPPFCAFCLLLFTSEEEAAAKRGAEKFRSLFEQHFVTKRLPIRLLGDTMGDLPKMSGRYRAKLLVKCRNDRNFRDALREVLATYRNTPESRHAPVTADLAFDGTF